MSFAVTPEAYNRFMGRFSEPLAGQFVRFADPRPGGPALDVGCGPGALTAELVRLLGEDAVSAVDPSPTFLPAVRSRFPAVDAREAVAEKLPFPDDTFDAALGQLVVHFMDDPLAGLREMGRVTRPGGVVAACVWDHAGGTGPLGTFWRAAREVDAGIHDESDLPGTREGHLVELCGEAGLRDVEQSRLTVAVGFAVFDDWWEPFTLGVGPAGAAVGRLAAPQREALRSRCEELLGPAPFEIAASAWAVRARA